MMIPLLLARSVQDVRSVVEAELNELIYGLDNAYVVCKLPKFLLEVQVEIDDYVDTGTALDVFSKRVNLLEKHLLVENIPITKSNRKGELK